MGTDPVVAASLFLIGAAFVTLILLAVNSVVARQFDKRGIYDLDDPRRYNYGKHKNPPK